MLSLAQKVVIRMDELMTEELLEEPPNICVHIGGPDENLCEIAEDFETEYVIERDDEGRYLRDYVASVENLLCAYLDRYKAEILHYDSPDVSNFGGDVQRVAREVIAAREHRASQLQDPTYYVPCIHEALQILERLVRALSDSCVTIVHHNDRGGRVACEVYNCGSLETCEIITQAIEDVFAVHLHTREDIERVIAERVESHFATLAGDGR